MGDEMLGYYSRRAEEYEKIYARPERQADLAHLAGHVAEIVDGRRVLEIACGTGYWTRVMAGRAACVLATDASPEMLAVARAQAAPTEKILWGIADAFRLDTVVPFPVGPAPQPLADFGPFDGLFAGFWWSHVRLADLTAFLEAAMRAVEPGAQLVFLDNRYVPGSSTPISRTDAGGNTWQRRRLADGSEHEILKNFPDEAEIVAAVKPFAGNHRATWSTYFWMLSCTSRARTAGPT